jgi:hypothetical protein
LSSIFGSSSITALSSIGALGSISIAILFAAVGLASIGVAATVSGDSSDIDAGGVQSVDILLVALGYDSLDGLLKVRTRVGGTSCSLL